MTPFWRSNDVIITSCVQGVSTTSYVLTTVMAIVPTTFPLAVSSPNTLNELMGYKNQLPDE